MSRDDIIVFYAMHHADSPATNSFCCLVDKGISGGYSNKQWFGNKYCSYKKLESLGTVIEVSAPRWLLDKKEIINLITKI